MKEISSLFESLYSHFLLRDVAAKVLPGSISLGILLKLLYPDSLVLLQELLEQSVLVWMVVVYGLGLMFGMFLQAIAARFGLIVIHVWQDKDGKYDQKISLEKAIIFLESANDQPALLRKRERLVILKEMAGNYSISVLFLSIGLLVQLIEDPEVRNTEFYIALGGLIFFFFALLWQNRFQAREQKDWQELVVDLPIPLENHPDTAA